MHRLLLSGIPVEFSEGEEKRTDLVNLIHFANPRNNDFLLVSQFTVAGTKQPRRPDLVAFVNGLPLAVIELKNPANEQTDIGMPSTRSRPTRKRSETSLTPTWRWWSATASRRAWVR